MRNRLARTCGLIAVVLLPAVVHSATFTPLGDLPGGFFDSEAFGVSADGTVVVGQARAASADPVSNPQGQTEAFRWTQGTGMVGLGDLDGGIFRSNGYGVSADGNVVVGTSNGTAGYRAFRWTSGTGLVGLGTSPSGAFGFSAWATSADGAVVVGDGQTGSTAAIELEPFRWTSSGGLAGLGFLPGGTFSEALDVSGDGAIAVGRRDTAAGIEAFRWTAGGGFTDLGDLPDGDFGSEARAISADGTVIVGSGTTGVGDDALQRAVRWTGNGAPVALDAGTFSSAALDVSADGTTIVGFAFFNGLPEAFVWTEATGLQRLFDLLVANGATGLTDDQNQTSWRLAEARGVSADGLTVVGVGINLNGDNEAFTAHLAAVPIGPTAPLLATGIALLGAYRRRRHRAT